VGGAVQAIWSHALHARHRDHEWHNIAKLWRGQPVARKLAKLEMAMKQERGLRLNHLLAAGSQDKPLIVSTLVHVPTFERARAKCPDWASEKCA
jgi:hypothetical protein